MAEETQQPQANKTEGNPNRGRRNDGRNRNRSRGRGRGGNRQGGEGQTQEQRNKGGEQGKGGSRQGGGNRGGSRGGGRGRRRNAPAPTDKALLESVQKNHEIQKERLNPHYKLDLSSNEKVRITPLGGLGEIGGNITVFETEKEAILIDVGMSFPDEEMHGVDILVPDFSYIREIKDKIVAVIIT
ncbi:MAG: ribonuclease J, partial [Sulfurimonadaceae bacterium]|nr:ribonuclease J [Sulfurimonadaceae bacterium]